MLLLLLWLFDQESISLAYSHPSNRLFVL